MGFGAVLFDLDGTLLDTLRDLADSMNAVLASHGFPTHPVDAYRHLVGDGVRRLVERALPGEAGADAAAVDAGVEEMVAAYRLRWHASSRPYAGVDVLLDGLEDRGLPFAILSNKPDEFTRRTTEALLGRWSFAAVWGVKEDVPPKPDPTGALALARALDVSPDEVLYCGDTATDMVTAVRAGMFAAGALWGFRDAEELRASGAEVLLETPPDLLALL